MMHPNIKMKPVWKKILTIVLLAGVLFSLTVLAGHPDVIEAYYSKTFYLALCRLLHPLFNLFPFSIGDLLYLFVIGYLLYALYRLLRLLLTTKFKRAGLYLLSLFIGLQLAVLAFYLLWGLNYFRPPAAVRLKLTDTAFTTTNLKNVTRLLIDSANATRARLTAADLAQGNSAIYATAISAVKKLSADSADFRTYSPGIKPSLLSPLLNYLGTSGYYNPFTTESQINYQMPVFSRPFVACHELAHQMGYGPEDEADFAGFMAGVGSNDKLLRYSVYHLAVDEFMHSLRRRDTVANNELKKRLSPQLRADFKAERDYWLYFENNAGFLSSLLYDDFLKANNQPQGIDTYNRMVLLVMAWYKKEWGG